MPAWVEVDDISVGAYPTNATLLGKKCFQRYDVAQAGGQVLLTPFSLRTPAGKIANRVEGLAQEFSISTRYLIFR